MTPDEISPDRLRDARELAGLSQQRLAVLLGVAPRTIANWENAAGGGVPRRQLRRVWARFGEQLRAADQNVDAQPDGGGAYERAFRRNALAEFTDEDLIAELLSRTLARRVGVAPGV